MEGQIERGGTRNGEREREREREREKERPGERTPGMAKDRSEQSNRAKLLCLGL